MDRPKRAAASKVTNFRKFHLSGDLDTEISGLVDTRINQFEMATTAEELQKQLEEEREQSRKLQEDAELLKIRNALEVEKLKQQQWKSAIAQLEEVREQAAQEHEKCMEQMKEFVNSSKATGGGTLDWLKDQIEKLNLKDSTGEDSQQLKAKQEREEAIRELKRQQQDINSRLVELESGGPLTNPSGGEPKEDSQEVLLQQLKIALSGKKEEDSNKLLLKALITQQNKTTGEGGTSTLRPATLNKLVADPREGMAEWLAGLNKQDEGESQLFCLIGEEDPQNRPTKVRSGILDKATTNIQQKQV